MRDAGQHRKQYCLSAESRLARAPGALSLNGDCGLLIGQNVGLLGNCEPGPLVLIICSLDCLFLSSPLSCQQLMTVRTITGNIYYARSGTKIVGKVHEKFTLIDGIRVATGSYRYVPHPSLLINLLFRKSMLCEGKAFSLSTKALQPGILRCVHLRVSRFIKAPPVGGGRGGSTSPALRSMKLKCRGRRLPGDPTLSEL